MNVIGHQKIKDLLEREIKAQNFAQAYIFSGPKGVGKTTLAKEFARGLILGKSFSALSEKEFTASDEADIVLVSPVVEEKRGVVKEKEITLEQILAARKEMANFPYHGKIKALIVKDADRMTSKAQNALLKITEEPNSTSVIILTTSRSNMILPTIQSRCRNINFGLVEQKEMENYLKTKRANISQEVVDLSMGRPAILLELVDSPEKIDWYRNSKKSLDQALAGGLNEKLKLAENLSKNVPEAIRNLEFWLWKSRSGQLGLEKAEKISETIEKIKNTNASARLILENLFINI